MSVNAENAIGVPQWGEDRKLLWPIKETTRGQRILLISLFVVAMFGWSCVIRQWVLGVGITGLGKPLYWGFYITHFVFFIGISHAGTLVSAILRLSNAEWRRPITRIAEAITAFSLIVGASHVLIDMGRIDRMLNIVFYPQPKSPLFWDVCSISLYLMSSLVYLYAPLIPDIAMCREEYRNSGSWRFHFYRVLSLNWQGTEAQTKRLHKVINFLMIFIIPVAVSVHTVISYIFAMTIQPMWHSSIFGPYFVVGAIYSGIGALMIVMAVVRKAFHLENYFKLIHFRQLGLVLLVMTILWFYFTFGEYLPTYYKNEPHELTIFMSKMHGDFAWLFWGMVLAMTINFFILAIPYFRTITGFAISGVLINIGMWIERFVIITPTLTHPALPYKAAHYIPTFWEWGEFLGSVAGFILLYFLFAKLFPLISVWEIKEGREEAIHDVVKRVESYMPDPAEKGESKDQ